MKDKNLPIDFSDTSNLLDRLQKLTEKDLYYKPDIKEFYPGFEYEEFSKFDNVEKWTPCIYGTDGNSWELNSMKFRIDRGDFRVKFLDADDIKDLGFDQGFGDKTHFEKMTEKNYIVLKFSKWNKGIEIRIDKYIMPIILFTGVLFNKSELKDTLDKSLNRMLKFEKWNSK